MSTSVLFIKMNFKLHHKYVNTRFTDVLRKNPYLSYRGRLECQSAIVVNCIQYTTITLHRTTLHYEFSGSVWDFGFEFHALWRKDR